MGKYANFVCDLHGHTNRSDGNDTPLEFLQHAVKREMKIIAITDHDKTPPKTVRVNGEEQDIVAYAASLGLILLRGIEISCETGIEDVHLVCFGCDWQSDYFQKLDEFTIRSKVESYRELVDRLSKNGMELSWEELLYNHGVLIQEQDVQKKMIFNLMAEKGYTKSWSDAKLLVKKNKNLSVNRKKPEAVEVIHEIHRQGGIVIQAHPYLVTEQVDYAGQEMSRHDLIEHFIYEGLDGIEGRYTYDKTSYNGRLGKEQIYREILSRYKDKVSIISGGSDYHGDGKKGIKNPREMGECGLTEAEFYGNPILCRLISEQKEAGDG